MKEEIKDLILDLENSIRIWTKMKDELPSELEATSLASFGIHIGEINSRKEILMKLKKILENN